MPAPAKTRISQLRQLIAGLPKVAPTLVLRYGTQTYDTPQLVQMLQELVDAETAVVDARAALQAATQALHDVEAKRPGRCTRRARTVSVARRRAGAK
jgi:hypothetical protein